MKKVNFPNIPIPSTEQVKLYLEKWKELENYVAQESSLRKLFTRTYPQNNDLDEVLIKVCSLNDFYSTNIFKPITVAKHIVNLSIDGFLQKHDLEIVNKIAWVELDDEKNINFYSFATKYCSHHFPEQYPIYDNYVKKILMYFKRTGQFCKFKKDDLKQYLNYYNILQEFKKFYNLNEFTLKDIDKYLWQLGKFYFPKSY